MSNTSLGRVQLKIMKVVWERQRATARDIADVLNKERFVAHSTVQTLLRQLEEKGAISHDVEDRTFIYFPTVLQESVARCATRDLVERVFEGSAAGLVAYLLEEEQISRKELRQLRELIEKKTSKKGS